ncbi:MAG: dihydroorotate dehydrogenase-like protein [Myxococcota bacterium]
MDLRTTYLGLELAHPFMPGASPLVDDLDAVRRLEDAGAAAIVMHSLFEEQITREQLARLRFVDFLDGLSPEARGYLPDPDAFTLGPDAYLDQIRRIKEAVSVPVIASLNGTTRAGWLDHARLMEEAGADALELNVYAVAADPDVAGEAIEAETLAMVAALDARVRIPVALKVCPFYSSLAHFARRVEAAGAEGLVLFNRLFQADIDPVALEVRRVLHLSDSSELPVRLRWLAILSARVGLSLGASGGVHTATDAVQALMAGAHGVQMVSALLKHGPRRLTEVRLGVETWMEEHGYHSLAQLRGCMDLSRCPDPAGYERANYLHLIESWRAS